MPPGPPSRADPLEQARPARVSKAQPCWQAAGCWCLAGGAMPLFGGRPELASSHRAHGRLMQLLSNSQTRIRGERGRRCGGLWAAAPHIGLGGPSSFRGSPHLTLPAPGTSAWSKGESGVRREHRGLEKWLGLQVWLENTPNLGGWDAPASREGTPKSQKRSPLLRVEPI